MVSVLVARSRSADDLIWEGQLIRDKSFIGLGAGDKKTHWYFFGHGLPVRVCDSCAAGHPFYFATDSVPTCKRCQHLISKVAIKAFERY